MLQHHTAAPQTALRSVARRRGYAPLTEDERNSLVEAHLPQVRYIAERMAAKLPPSVDRDDLIGAGVLGLIDAVGKFDPTRGVLFKTYAERRVRGAILDSLRDLDWVPRSVRRRAKEIEGTYARLQSDLGRTAEGEEVAAALGLPIGEFNKLLGELSGLTVTSIATDEDGWGGMQNVGDDEAETPLAIYEREELRERLAEAVDALPPREREVVALYYVEELTMKEIGAVLGVTESRVSQIRSQAVLNLRATLGRLAA